MHEFNRKAILLGFGAVGLAFLELARRAGLTRDMDMTVVSEDFIDSSALTAGDVRVISHRFTKADLETTLTRLAPPGSVIINCFAGVASIDVMRFAAARRCMYIDTSVENWDGEETETHERQAVVFANRHALRDAPPLIINHGMNPGLISHFVKEVLDTEWSARGQRDRRDWARMAKELGVVGVHVSEIDDQTSALVPDPGQFYATWSIKSFQCESLETSIHALGSAEPTGHGSVLTLPDGLPGFAMPSVGMRTLATSFTPSRGRYLGYVMSHVEAFTIAALLTERSGEGNIGYRPSVLFCYRPCPLAVWSLGQTDWDRRAEKLLLTEIDDGADEIGVTLFRGPREPLIWYGSTLTDRESRLISPRSNATSVQVAAGLYAGLLAGLKTTQRGVLEPEDLEHRPVLAWAKPYLGALRREIGPADAIDPHFVFSAPAATTPPVLDPQRDRPRAGRRESKLPRTVTTAPFLAALDPAAVAAPYEQWMEEHGSPLLVYSETALRSLCNGFETFAAGLRRPARIAFAVKACPAPAVLGLMRTAGFGAEVNGQTEYRRAISAGFDPRSILINGVAKATEYLDAALQEGCRTINIDSVEEIAFVAARARACGRRQHVHLRLCPRLAAGSTAQLATGDAGSKFGILPEDVAEAFSRLANESGALGPIGLHVHLGSGGILEDVYDSLIVTIMEAVRGAASAGLAVDEINLGGGFRSCPERPKEIAGAARIAAAIGHLPEDMPVAFEPGRFLVEQAASMFCRISGIKQKGTDRWILLDCGYAQITDIAILGERYPVQAATPQQGSKIAVRIGGPLCDSADEMRAPRDLRFPETSARFSMPGSSRIGDLVEIGSVGAYVYGTGNNFCGATQPAVLLTDASGAARVIRRAETLADIGRCEYA